MKQPTLASIFDSYDYALTRLSDSPLAQILKVQEQIRNQEVSKNARTQAVDPKSNGSDIQSKIEK